MPKLELFQLNRSGRLKDPDARYECHLQPSLGERHEKASPLKPDAQAKDAPQRILRLRVRLRFAVRQFLPLALRGSATIAGQRQETACQQANRSDYPPPRLAA